MKPGFSRKIEGYLFISPWLIGFLFFVAGPMVYSLVLSFQKWSLMSEPKFIGLQNYAKLSGDPLMWLSLKNTVYYVFGSVPLRLFLALILAVLINQKIAGTNLYRAILYSPSLITGVALAVVWMWMFQPDYGLVNSLLSRIGISGPRWLGSTEWAMPALILMSLWTIGSQMVIFLAGLQDIPGQLYEAAALDGANAWQRFTTVTLPMLSPVILFNLIMNIIQSFQVFEHVYIMTGGGPANSTLVAVLYLYDNAFKFFKMGYASAFAWILFLIILVMTLVVLRTSQHWVHYQGGV
ncbi:MAG: sugar ABC transporter permease [Firmicutes bacterium]|nr:sugar ABC transporter permease [Bacillota bacterium]